MFNQNSVIMDLVITVVAILMYINLKKTPERSYWVQNLSIASDTISSHSISDRVYLEDGNESGYVSSHDLSHMVRVYYGLRILGSLM